MVESDSSSCDSDNDPKKDGMYLMETPNPMLRLAYYGKLKRMITSYKNSKLKTLDRRLLRGLFIKNINDFDEDYHEFIQTKSLLDRLRGALLPITSPISF